MERVRCVAGPQFAVSALATKIPIAGRTLDPFLSSCTTLNDFVQIG